MFWSGQEEIAPNPRRRHDGPRLSVVLFLAACLLGGLAVGAAILRLAAPGMGTYEIALAQGYAIRSSADTASADAAMARFLSALPAIGIVFGSLAIIAVAAVIAIVILKRDRAPRVENKTVVFVLPPGQKRVEYWQQLERGEIDHDRVFVLRDEHERLDR